MNFNQLMQTMSAAAVAGDGQAVAACFTPDGTYHDVFYGAFTGREAIADMIENYFHRDGENFIWDLHDAIDNGAVGYVRYIFSYTAKLKGFEGRRSLFEGVAVCRLTDGHIHHYSEVGNAATGLSLMGFAPERVVRFIEREARDLTERPEAAAHVAGHAGEDER